MTTELLAQGLPKAAHPSTTPLDRNPAVIYLKRLARGEGRRTMRGSLDRIAEIVAGPGADAVSFPWPLLEYQHVQAIREELASRYAPSSCNKMLSALRGVLKEAWRIQLIDSDTYHRAVDIERVRGSSAPRGRALGAHEIAALFHACQLDRSPAGARDAAMLAIGYAGGLRRAEIVFIDLSDYDPAGGDLLVRRGKGRKQRRVRLHNGAGEAVSAWLEHRGSQSGPLLCPVRKDGTVELRRLSTQAVRAVCRKRGAQAGIRGFAPHDLRRSCVSAMLDGGVDLNTARRVAGHASTNTTAAYDLRGERAVQEAGAVLVVPYNRSGLLAGSHRTERGSL